MKELHITGCLRTSVRRASRAQAALCSILDAQIRDIKQAGTWKDERVINTRQSSEIGVQGRSDKLLNFCANNYLGLSVSCIHDLYMYIVVNAPTIMDISNGNWRPPPPPPNFNFEKMAGFKWHTDSSLILGGGGLNYSFYFVQDCSVWASVNNWILQMPFPIFANTNQLPRWGKRKSKKGKALEFKNNYLICIVTILHSSVSVSVKCL